MHLKPVTYPVGELEGGGGDMYVNFIEVRTKLENRQKCSTFNNTKADLLHCWYQKHPLGFFDRFP